MLKNLLLWFSLKIQKPSLGNSTTKYAALVFELGDLQVFHLLKEHERPKEKTIVPYEVYWQSKRTKIVFGPFVDTYSAMSHHSLSIQSLPSLTVPIKLPGTLIEVDFKSRKRK